MFNVRISTVDGSRILIQCTDKMVLWFTDNEVRIAPILKPGEQHLIVTEKTPSKTETCNLSIFIYSVSNIKQFIIG